MEDVYLARKRNVNGGVFGFVRYCKVKDVDKLLKAINKVWFGDWKVVAKVASFDKFGKSQVVGVKRAEGDKMIEGEKSKHEGAKNYKGVNKITVVREEERADVARRENVILENDKRKEAIVVTHSKQQYVPMYRSDIQDV